MNRKNRTRNNTKLVPVSIDGKTVMVDANSIKRQDRTIHHGETAEGIKVNSAQSYDIGDSTIAWPSDGAPAVSFLKADLEVLATQFLEGRGLTVGLKA